MNTLSYTGSALNSSNNTKVTGHPRDKHMTQQKQTIKKMPIDKHCYYYTVKPRKNHVLKARNQVLQIISGSAWVSCGGQDYMLQSGDAMVLTPQDDKVVVVSGLIGKAVCYTIKD